jgi:hypothetical protein
MEMNFITANKKENVIYQASNKGKNKPCYLNITEELTTVCAKKCKRCKEYLNYSNAFNKWIELNS